MRFGPPFDHARRQDGRRLKGIPDDWQLYAVELAAA